jgi:flavodoxin
MKTLVVYSSKSGNTKKLAEAIWEGLGEEKEINSMEDAPDPSGFDLICVGFWLMAGKPDPKAQEFLSRLSTQKLFLFATHGASAASPHARNAMAEAKRMAPDADIIGSFNCQGEVNPAVLEKAGAKPEPPIWLADAPAAKGHPDEADLKNINLALQKSLQG